MAKLRAYTTGASTASNTTTITFPTYAANDLLIIWVGIESTYAFSTPSGWTQYSMTGRTSGSGSADLYYKIAAASETPVVLTQTSSTTGKVGWQCLSVQDVDTGTPVDASANAVGSSAATHSAPRPTTATNNALVQYFCSSYTALGNRDPTLNFGHLVWKGNADPAGGVTQIAHGDYWEFWQTASQVPQRTWTLTAANEVVMVTLCIRDASPTVAPTIPAYIPEVFAAPIALDSYYNYVTAAAVKEPIDRTAHADQSLDLSATGGFGTFGGFTAANDITFTASTKILSSVSSRFANCRIGDNITITGTSSNNKTGLITVVTSNTSITWDQTTVNESPASCTLVTNSRKRMVLSTPVDTWYYNSMVTMDPGTGTLPTGLAANTAYQMTWTSSTIFNFKNNTGSADIWLTAAGTGTNLMKDLGIDVPFSYSGTKDKFYFTPYSTAKYAYGGSLLFSTPQNLSGKVFAFLGKATYYSDPSDKILNLYCTFLNGSNVFTTYKYSVFGGILNPNTTQYWTYVLDPANTTSRIKTIGSFDATAVTAVIWAVDSPMIQPSNYVASPSIFSAMKLTGGCAASPAVFEDYYKLIVVPTANLSPGGLFGGVTNSFPCFTLQGNAQFYPSIPIQVGDGTNNVYANFDGTSLEFIQGQSTVRKSYQSNLGNNDLGIEYYLSAGSNVSHQNSVVTSGQQFYFKINASSSASATYNFSGLTVVGAGIVTLQPVTTFTGMIFSGCAEIAASGCALTNCTVNHPLAAQTAALQMSTTSTLIGCKFATLTAADYAIQLDTAGTYTLNACTFTGFTSSLNVTATTGTVTVNITNGGDIPTYVTAGATVVVQTLNTFTVTCKDVAGNNIQNVRISVRKVSDNTELIGGLTNSSGVLTDTFTYAGAILIRARKSTGGTTRYLEVSSPQVLTASAFSLIITMIEDSIASA